MKRVIYTCDRCGNEISGVKYTLTCYAEDIVQIGNGGCSADVAMQNSKQNFAIQSQEAHLCKDCKDKLTDGVFIV